MNTQTRTLELAKHEENMCKTGITSLEWELAACKEARKVVSSDKELVALFNDDIKMLEKTLRYYKERHAYWVTQLAEAQDPQGSGKAN